MTDKRTKTQLLAELASAKKKALFRFIDGAIFVVAVEIAALAGSFAAAKWGSHVIRFLHRMV